jgi:hypothetical protein
MEIRSARTVIFALGLIFLGHGESVPTPAIAPQAQTADYAATQLVESMPDSAMPPSSLSTSPWQLLAQAHH